MDDLKGLLEAKLKVYGLLNINEHSYGKRKIYIAHLMPLSCILQNRIVFFQQGKDFKLSSGILFDFKDVPQNLAEKVEAMVRSAASKRGFEAWRAGDNLFIRKVCANLEKLEDLLLGLVKAIQEVNELFSMDEEVREECMRKKELLMFDFG